MPCKKEDAKTKKASGPVASQSPKAAALSAVPSPSSPKGSGVKVQP